MSEHKEFSEEWMKERGFYKTAKKEHSEVDMSFAPDEEEEKSCPKGHVPCDGRNVQLSALAQALQNMNVIDDVEEDKAEEAIPKFRENAKLLNAIDFDAIFQKVDWETIEKKFDPEQYLAAFDTSAESERISQMLTQHIDHHRDAERYQARVYDYMDYTQIADPYREHAHIHLADPYGCPDVLDYANVMNLKPGDMVVLTTPTVLLPAVMQQAEEWLRCNYSFRVPVINLTAGNEIQTLNDKQLQQLGLQRIDTTKRGN